MKFSPFAKYSWGVLGFNLAVILWGAFVRATGSGAGCGSHWPLCNGEIVPFSPETGTLIEYTHRLSSGLSLLLVLILLAWAFRSYPKKHPVRLGAVLCVIFILTEALVGAGLVLFEWVAQDASIGRVISMSVHLINTFLLLASLTLTAWWASGGLPIHFKQSKLLITAFILSLMGVLVLGVSGAITALGDTIFPASSLIEGFKQDFSPATHIILRLRIWHPIIAVIVGSYLVLLSGLIAMYAQDELRSQKQILRADRSEALTNLGFTRRFSLLLIAWVGIQLILGLVNLALLAPVWIQLVHLFLADVIWITLILLVATSFGKIVEVAEAPGTSQVTNPDKAQNLNLSGRATIFNDMSIE